jgi:hypothetical protein
MGCPFIASMPMQLSLDPDVADLAPTDPALARYDEEHLVTYLRMLDANEQGADWREVSRGTDRVPGGSGAPSSLHGTPKASIIFGSAGLALMVCHRRPVV